MAFQAIVTIILAFIIAHIFTSTEIFIFSYGFEWLSSIFDFTLYESLWVSLGRSVGSSLLAFVDLWMSSFLPHSWKDSFAGYGILSWHVFSFNILNVSAHCLLVTKASNEKSADNLTEDPLYMTSHSVLLYFKDYFCLCLLVVWFSCVSGWSLFEFVPLAAHWACWIFIFKSSSNHHFLLYLMVTMFVAHSLFRHS